MNGDLQLEQAPPEVHHYSHVGEVPWDIQKFVRTLPMEVQTNPPMQLLVATIQVTLEV